MSACPPSFVLERFRLEGVADPERRAHLEGCGECQARLRALAEEDAAFLQGTLAKGLGERLKTAPARPAPWRRAAPVILALAAGLVAFMVRRDPGTDLSPKGGPGELLMYAAHGDQIERYQGGALRAKDALQLVWSGARAGHLLAIGIEASGQATVLYPEGGVGSSTVGAARTNLGGRIELRAEDDGDRICVLWAESPFPFDDRAIAECRSQGPRLRAAIDLSVQP
ncbi:MAG: hypothetical protein U1E65_31590 [Myxococcota bacterium]